MKHIFLRIITLTLCVLLVLCSVSCQKEPAEATRISFKSADFVLPVCRQIRTGKFFLGGNPVSTADVTLGNIAGWSVFCGNSFEIDGDFGQQGVDFFHQGRSTFLRPGFQISGKCFLGLRHCRRGEAASEVISDPRFTR